MDKMTNYEMIYRLAKSNKMHLEELLGYLKQDSDVSNSRIETVKEELDYLSNIENNISKFVKERGEDGD